MSVVINTNYSATVAANNLSTANTMLQKSLNRLSSGKKIVSPADDAGGLAVSMKLAAASKRQGAVNNNLGNVTSYLQTQDGALKVAGEVLDRMSELKTLYADPTKNANDQANYDSEFVALQGQLNSLSNEQFNGVNLFGSAGGAGLTVAATEDGSTSTAITLNNRSLTSTTAGVGAVVASGISSLGSTGLSLSTITSAIQNVASLRATNGADQSRVGFASELLTTNKANLEAATSRILDVDVAQESTQLARWNTLVQAGTAMLSQANGSAQTALRLLQ
jgi:flagellin